MQAASTTDSLHDFSWIYSARVLAIFFMILAHVNEGWGGPQWAQTFYHTLTRMGIPLFFMCTGCLMLSKQESLISFIKNHLLPILISFFAWSALYDILGNSNILHHLDLQNILKLFTRILRAQRIGYFWFFYALLGLYFFTPVLRIIISKASQTIILYFIALWFFDVAIMPMIRNFISLKYGLEVPFSTRYLGYFMLGFYLYNVKTIPIRTHYLLLTFVLSFAFTFMVFYFNIPPVDNEDFFRSYLSFDIIFMTTSAFLLLRMVIHPLASTIKNIVNFLDQSAFGVYLIHLLVLGQIAAWLKELGLNTIHGNPFIAPLIAIFAFLISLVPIYMLRIIPLVKNVVPQPGA